MEDRNAIYLSKDFPEVCEAPENAGPYSLIVRTLSEVKRGAVVVAGSRDETLELDEEVWESHIGKEFRDLCDTHLELKKAILQGCKQDEVLKAFDAVNERMAMLRDVILVASYDNASKPRCVPDIGTVVSVGGHHQDKYSVGDKVAVRPGDLYLDDGDKSFRVLKDQWEHGDFLYDVTDSVPLKLTDEGPEPTGSWVLAKRNRIESKVHSSQVVYTDGVYVEGSDFVFIVKDPVNDLLTFRDPGEWGLTEDHCLVDSSRLTAMAEV